MFCVYVCFSVPSVMAEKCICENPGGLRNFFILTYSHPGTAGFSVWNYYVQSNFIGEDQCSLSPFPYVLDHRHIYFESLCQLTFFGGGEGGWFSWQPWLIRMALLIHLVAARLAGLGGPKLGWLILTCGPSSSWLVWTC